MERSRGACAGPETPCAGFSARFVQVTAGPEPPVRERVNRAIEALVARGGADASFGEPEGPATVAEAADGFFAAWDAFRAEAPASWPGPARWSDERVAEVVHADRRVLSVEIAARSESGGAHPSTHTRLVSFDLATGQRLALRDLFEPGAEELLDAVGEEAFRRARGVSPGEPLERAGFWFDGGFHLNDNFALTPRGLTFVFNPYEVGPYALGPTRLELPWSALSDLLRPGAPVGSERQARSRPAPRPTGRPASGSGS